MYNILDCKSGRLLPTYRQLLRMKYTAHPYFGDGFCILFQVQFTNSQQDEMVLVYQAIVQYVEQVTFF